MGRRRNPKTKEEIQAELTYAEDQIRKLKNQEKMYANALKNEERRQRTRRLCTEAGILERYVPELKEMSEQDAAEFIQIAATCPEATDFLRKRRIRQDENETAPTMERPLEVFHCIHRRIRGNTDKKLKAHLYVTSSDRASFGDSYRYRCGICGEPAPLVRQEKQSFPCDGCAVYPFPNPPPDF